MDNECIFCKIAKGEIKSDFIYENDNFFSVFDVKPLVKGHCLIISKEHFKNVLEMPSNLGEELLDCVKKTSLKVIKEFESDGFNLIANTNEAAGQVIPHVHFHVIPRNKNDGINFLKKEE